MKLEYYCDNQGHLVCLPYTIDNLHQMANELGLDQSHFKSHPKHAHYLISDNQKDTIMPQCHLVSSKHIIYIVRSRNIKIGDIDGILMRYTLPLFKIDKNAPTLANVKTYKIDWM